MALRIEDYAMIGNCRTAALVGRDGSIDWLCWPRFDSAACFAALLGEEKNGHWGLAPVAEARSRRRYRDGTLILETTFETEDGRVDLVDFMIDGTTGPQSLIRMVHGRAGRVRMRTELMLRFDYGLTVPWVTRQGEDEWHFVAGPDRATLRTPAPIRGEDMRSIAEFEVGEGEVVPFVLTLNASYRPPAPRVDAQAALEEVEREWTEWSGRCTGAGDWSEAVCRSLSTLRGLTYHETGGIVAAVTTSLPEFIGGQRNWDYRYCWLRDATFTLTAMMNAGYYEESRAWRDWLFRAISGSPDQIQIMYGVAGERLLPERTLPWLAGYEQSAPVRVGNAAAEQVQLDVFGEVAHAMMQARKGGIEPDEHGLSLRKLNLARLAKIWSQPDEGIWEIRGASQHFVHSKVMVWVAFQRALDNPIGEPDPEMLALWKRTADAIHAEVCAKGFDPVQNTFVQSYGSERLDAALLLLPIMGFLPADDPRIAGTVAAIEKRLLAEGFVMRYETESGVDGLPPGEGAFLPCSFWLADVYAMQGRLDEARALFERLLALRNDVGLLAEEYDPRAKRMLGNFPQAFSHVALVNTAFTLSRALAARPD